MFRKEYLYIGALLLLPPLFFSFLFTRLMQFSGAGAPTGFINDYVAVNTSTPVAAVAVTTPAGVRPMEITSSTNARMLALLPSGQFIVGPNSLAQTGHLALEHPTTNDIALSFTNGTNYTFQLGRVSSGVAYIGGPTGTTLNLRANGVDQMFIRANFMVGIGTSTPVANLSVASSTVTTTISIGGPGVGKLCFWNGASWSIESYASNSITPTVVTSTSCS